jgi:hypothetical protein
MQAVAQEVASSQLLAHVVQQGRGDTYVRSNVAHGAGQQRTLATYHATDFLGAAGGIEALAASIASSLLHRPAVQIALAEVIASSLRDEGGQLAASAEVIVSYAIAAFLQEQGQAVLLASSQHGTEGQVGAMVSLVASSRVHVHGRMHAHARLGHHSHIRGPVHAAVQKIPTASTIAISANDAEVRDYATKERLLQSLTQVRDIARITVGVLAKSKVSSLGTQGALEGEATNVDDLFSATGNTLQDGPTEAEGMDIATGTRVET